MGSGIGRRGDQAKIQLTQSPAECPSDLSTGELWNATSASELS